MKGSFEPSELHLLTCEHAHLQYAFACLCMYINVLLLMYWVNHLLDILAPRCPKGDWPNTLTSAALSSLTRSPTVKQLLATTWISPITSCPPPVKARRFSPMRGSRGRWNLMMCTWHIAKRWENVNDTRWYFYSGCAELPTVACTGGGLNFIIPFFFYISQLPVP
jgi:hypothetical protein